MPPNTDQLTTDKFWNKASDIFNLYHNKYRFAILTDEEKRETVTDFLAATDDLVDELIAGWHNPETKE